jgi:FkbM family methyltransferase
VRPPWRVRITIAALRATWPWRVHPRRSDPRRIARRAAERLHLRAARQGDTVWSAYGVPLADRGTDETFVLCVLGTYGYRLADLLREQAPGAVLLDIGANVGLYSLIAGRSGAAAVHAVEPDPDTTALLERNLRDVATARIHPVALSDAPGQTTLHRVPGHSGRSSLEAEVVGSSGSSIPVTAVDGSYLDGNVEIPPGRRVVVKIDVEGHELDVLRALRRWSGWSAVTWMWIEFRSGPEARIADELLRSEGFVEVERVGGPDQWDARYERRPTISG